MRVPRGRRLRHRLRDARRRRAFVARSQSDETEIVARLVELLGAPQSFIEFGFSPVEFNCASIARTGRGLLVDAEERNVTEARMLLPRRLATLQRHLDLYNLHELAERWGDRELGVLSIDVDGNDYWFLEALLPRLRPAVVAVEYNASLGMRPIAVPYDARFDRHEKHASGLYHGASLVALTRLCARYGYRLVAVSAGGVNAFFVAAAHDALPTLAPETAYREEAARNELLGTTAAEQWAEIAHLPFVHVG